MTEQATIAPEYEDLADDLADRVDELGPRFPVWHACFAAALEAMGEHPDLHHALAVADEALEEMPSAAAKGPTREDVTGLSEPFAETAEPPVAMSANVSLAERVQAAADETEREPSDAAKKAGNYKKGKVSVQGLPITIETPRGAVRSGTDRSGKAWSCPMNGGHYGYIRGRGLSEADGDHHDCFLGPDPECATVYVIDQVNPDGSFDESKAMIGYGSENDARKGYLACYSPGWRGLGNITALSMDSYKDWLEKGDTGRPIAEQRASEAGYSPFPKPPATEQEPQQSLIDLPPIRQPNHYACGAACAMAVGRYFSVGPDRIDDWEKALGTTLEESTQPSAIVEYLTSLGLDVEARDGMTIDGLAECTRQGKPVIVCLQDYGGRREEGARYLYGHYIVVEGCGLGMVFAHDPSIENVEREPGGDVPRSQADPSGNIAAPGRIMIDQDKFLDVWHDKDATGTKFICYGIAVGPGKTGKAIAMSTGAPAAYEESKHTRGNPKTHNKGQFAPKGSSYTGAAPASGQGQEQKPAAKEPAAPAATSGEPGVWVAEGGKITGPPAAPPAPQPTPAPAAAKPEQAKPAAKPPAPAAATKNDPKFPADNELAQLTTVKALGGSTGAKLVKDKDGALYVAKQGADAGHLKEEDNADRMYRALGVPVPDSKVYETAKGPMKLSRFVGDAKPLTDLKGAEREKAFAQVKQHFVADALLGNWDVIGQNYENVLVTPQGQALRVDNGGSLRYRARGGQKTGAQWNGVVGEIDTMRDKNKGTVSGSNVYKDLTPAQIKGQVQDVMNKSKALLEATPHELRPVMTQRLQDLGKRFGVKSTGEQPAAQQQPAAAQGQPQPAAPRPAAPPQPPAAQGQNAIKQAVQLTPEHLAAMEDYKANGVKAKAFKNWFGDWEHKGADASKVVDADGRPATNERQPGGGSTVRDASGNPVVMYHGTKTLGWDAFDKSKIRDGNSLAFGTGFYFSQDKQGADMYAGSEGETKAVYLNIRKPLDLDRHYTKEEYEHITGKKWGLLRTIGRAMNSQSASTIRGHDLYGEMARTMSKTNVPDKDAVNRRLQEAGFDGITHTSGVSGGNQQGPESGRIWVAFEAQQMKGTNNIGTFDPNSPSLRLSAEGGDEPVALSADATGHEHKGKGEGGGQFTAKGQGGGTAAPETPATKPAAATKSGLSYLNDDMTRNHLQGLREEAHHNSDRQIASVLARPNWTGPKDPAVVKKALQDAYDKAEVTINLDHDYLPGILDSGEIKNTYQTGVKDANYMVQRRKIENLVLGDKGIPDADKPRYGVVNWDNNQHGGASMYGDVCFVLNKNALRDRATATPGNSFGHRDNLKVATTEDIGAAGIHTVKALEAAGLPLHQTAVPSYTEVQMWGNMPLNKDTVKEFRVPANRTAHPHMKTLMEYGQKHGIPVTLFHPDTGQELNHEQAMSQVPQDDVPKGPWLSKV